ncbi:VCBS repeat-containing protein [candidate division KSB1 bacterium]|nr:VCBS repeat-containing protein [candidate division KSB1 bacterium]
MRNNDSKRKDSFHFPKRILLLIPVVLFFQVKAGDDPPAAISYFKGEGVGMSVKGAVVLNRFGSFGNPSDSEADSIIRIILPEGTETSRFNFTIYTPIGQAVYRQKVVLDGGSSYLEWRGTTTAGEKLASGVYLFSFTPEGLFQDSPEAVLEEFYFLDITEGHFPLDSTYAGDVEFGDMDNDGDLDIVIGYNETSYSAGPRILINDGTGIFVDETNDRFPLLSTFTNDIDLVDVDGDDDLDIYMANTGVVLEECADILLINDSGGYFQDESDMRLPQIMEATLNVDFADIDGDLDLDIMCVFLPYPYGRVRVFINEGNGTFVDSTTGRVPLLEYFLFNVNFCDIDGDEDYDAILSSLGNLIYFDGLGNPIDTLSGQNVALMNNRFGYFTDETSERMPFAEDWTRDIIVTDVDSDGDPDLYELNISFPGDSVGINKILINDGSGYFFDETDGRLPQELFLWNNDADFADFDLDGDPDIYMVNVLPGQEAYDALYLNDSSGFFVDSSSLLPGILDFSVSCAVGDIDSDTDMDIVICNSGGVVGIGGQDRLYGNMLFSSVIRNAEATYSNKFELFQNYPNPFNPSTTIKYSLPEPGWVSLKVHNILGEEIAVLVDKRVEAGFHKVEWEATHLASGMYFYRIQAGDFVQTRKMLYLK